MKPTCFIRAIAAAGIGLSVSAVSVAALEATARSAVNVRSGPGTGYGKVDVLFAGEVVNITECRGNWCYVEHPGPDGWVSGRYLEANSPEDSAEADAGDAAALAILGAIVGGILAGDSPPPAPAPAPAPALPYGPDTCKTGFVWRETIPGDNVCVTPARRTLAAQENSIAGARVDPTGAYGPNSCKPGFVWREAYAGDVVCVSPARRTQVRQENLNGPSRRVVP